MIQNHRAFRNPATRRHVHVIGREKWQVMSSETCEGNVCASIRPLIFGPGNAGWSLCIVNWLYTCYEMGNRGAYYGSFVIKFSLFRGRNILQVGTYPGVRPVTKIVWGLNSREPGLRWSLFGLVDPDNGSRNLFFFFLFFFNTYFFLFSFVVL